MGRKVPRRIKNIGNIHNEMNKKWIISIIFIISLILVIVSIFSVYNAVNNQKNRSDYLSQSNDSSLEESSSIESYNIESSSTGLTSNNSFNSNVKEHDPIDLSYFNDAFFIGDSLTVGLGNYSIVPKYNVIADIGLSLDTIETKKAINTTEGSMTVLDALKLKNPKKIYIMLGSNGIAWIQPERLIQKYSSFLEKLKDQHPLSNIYISAILPVTNNKQQIDSRYANSKIAKYNELLYNLASENNVYFLDPTKSLSDSFGNLRDEIAESDGMHLKKKGYEELFNFYSTHTIQE